MSPKYNTNRIKQHVKNVHFDSSDPVSAWVICQTSSSQLQSVRKENRLSHCKQVWTMCRNCGSSIITIWLIKMPRHKKGTQPQWLGESPAPLLRSQLPVHARDLRTEQSQKKPPISLSELLSNMQMSDQMWRIRCRTPAVTVVHWSVAASSNSSSRCVCVCVRTEYNISVTKQSW